MKDGGLLFQAWAVLNRTVELQRYWLVYVCVLMCLYLLCGEVARVGVVGCVETRRGCETRPC